VFISSSLGLNKLGASEWLFSDRSSVSHDPHDATNTSNLNHFLMPTEQHAHSVTSTLASAEAQRARLHEKVVEVAGVGSIMRVMTDRRTV